MDTIGYYNKYASAIFEQTVEQDMEEHRYVNANAVLNEFANLTLGGFIKDRKTVQERFESAFLGEEYEEV